MPSDCSVKWMEQAQCHDAPIDDVFLGPSNKHVRDRKIDQLCGGCPVQSECYDYAVRHPDCRGIWGATSEIQRRNVRAENPDLSCDCMVLRSLLPG